MARWLASTGQWTWFAHGSDGSVLAEVTKTADPAAPWAPARDYVWLDGLPLAQVERSGGTADRYTYHLDHIGLPRALTNAAGTTVWSATPARPYGDLVETATPDPLTGRTVVTNLRLPGQYDERLLASLGLQGPYYNWNRWYLPGAGRYLELDPIALRGRFNARYGVEWYPYAAGSPSRFGDISGLRITNGVHQNRDTITTTTCHGAPGAACANAAVSFTRCKCDGATFKFDATVEFAVWREFVTKETILSPSCDSPGLAIGQHEDLHISDYKTGFAPGILDSRIQSEGFSSMAECEEHSAALTSEVGKYRDSVLAASEAARDKPWCRK